MDPPKSPTKLSLLAQEHLSFRCDLKTLSCIAREPGDAQELKIVRKELAERDARISRLEVTLQQREEARLQMTAQHDALQRQLDDARSDRMSVEFDELRKRVRLYSVLSLSYIIGFRNKKS